MKKSYPRIFFPYEIKKIAESKPSELKIPEIPELPKKQEFKKPVEVLENSSGCFINCLIAMIISGIGILLFQNGLEIGGLLAPIGGFVIIYYIFAGNTLKEKNEKRKKQYLDDLKNYKYNTHNAEADYQEKLTQYNFKKKNYVNDCKNIENQNSERQSDNFIISFRIQKLKLYLQKSKKPKLLSIINSKSVTHLFFKNFLSEKFPKRIYDNFYFKDSSYENIIYIPDYSFFDEELNLYINIEVDEPYIGSDGTPIHFLKGNDEDRDSFFTKKNWLVIRFAESQIIENPIGCCDLIGDVIEKLKKCIIEDFSTQSKIKIVECWTYEEANKLAFTRYRNTYLPENLKTNINDEKLEIDKNNLNPIYKSLDELPF